MDACVKLVYDYHSMADFENFIAPDINPESGSTGAEQSAEQREAQLEAFNEAQRKLAATQKKEKKAKKRDFSLAQILLYFIQHASTADKERILATLVALIRDDVPVEWVLGILSLNYPALQQLLAEMEEKSGVIVYSPAELIVERSVTQRSYALADFDEHNLPDEVKTDINMWVQTLMNTANMDTAMLLSKAFVQKEVGTLHISLASFVLQDYLKKFHIAGNFEKIRSFSSYILRGVLSAAGRKEG